MTELFFKTDQIERWKESRFEESRNLTAAVLLLANSSRNELQDEITNASNEFGVRFASGIVR